MFYYPYVPTIVSHKTLARTIHTYGQKQKTETHHISVKYHFHSCWKVASTFYLNLRANYVKVWMLHYTRRSSGRGALYHVLCSTVTPSAASLSKWMPLGFFRFTSESSNCGTRGHFFLSSRSQHKLPSSIHKQGYPCFMSCVVSCGTKFL